MNKHQPKRATDARRGSSIGRLRHTRLFAVMAVTLSCMAAGPALAQDAEEDRAQEQEQASQSDIKEFGAVIVTADKREESINEVPSSISVIGQDQLENLSATQLTDYANYVPGLQVTSGGTPGQTTVTLRGIAPLSSGATVGTYIDETPVGSSGLYQAATILALDLLPYDIERVEILRGPQGTLYGAGSMGGLLKYVMREPDLDDTEFRIGGGVSSVEDGGHGSNVRFGANLPLSEDRLGLRLSYARNNIPGYIDNSVTGEEDINEGHQTSARAALLWQEDAFSLKLSAMRQTVDSDNNAVVSLDPVTREPLDGDLTTRVYAGQPFTKEIDFYAATLEWDLGWVDFTSATGYSDTVTSRRQDTTVQYGEFTNLVLGLPEPGRAFFDTDLDLQKFTQEFRLTSKAGSPFEWLVGAFYTKEEGDNRQDISLRQADGSALPAPFDDMAGTLALLRLPTDYEETAFFANVGYQFNEVFKLGAGIRHARNEQNFNQIVEEGLLLPLGETPNSSSESVVTWSLAPQFQLSEDTLLYGKVATGYQPGGPNVALPGIPPTVDSSTLTSYELGLKTLFADRRVQLDLALFRIDWEDIQVATYFNGNTGLVNGGEATSQGVELSLMYRPSAGLTLGFNAAYTDASLTEDFPTLVIPSPPVVVELNSGLAGDRLPYVPELQASLTADYYFPLSGSWEGHVGGGFRYNDDSFAGTTERQVITTADTPPAVLQTTITPPFALDSYNTLDLYAGVTNGTWSIRAYLKNATDERAYTRMSDISSALTGVTESVNASLVRPRTFGLEFDYRF